VPSLTQCAESPRGLRQNLGATGRRHPVQERGHRPGRAWTEIGPEYGIERECALEERRLKALLEQIVHAHATDAQQLAHVAPAETADLPAEAQERGAVAPGVGAEPRGRLG